MIKKIGISELQEGMYVCGVEKAGAGVPDFFMNSMLVKSAKDIEGFAQSGHRCVYVEIMDAPAPPKPKDFSPPPAQAAEAEGGNPEEPLETLSPFEPLADGEEGLEEPAGAAQGAQLQAFEPDPPEEEQTCAPAPIEPPAPSAAGGYEVSGNAWEPPAPEEETPVTGNEAGQEPAPEEACVIEVVEPAAPPAGKGAQPLPAQGFANPAPEFQVHDTVSFEEELAEAKNIRDEAEGLVRDFMGRVRIDGGIRTDKVNRTVGRMVESVFKNQDALASLSRLKSRDDYTFAHCVNVCILSLALGRRMGFSDAQLNELGTGALLHDIGKMLVPERILKKPGPLTGEELAEMKRHTALGGEVLARTKDISDAARSVPLHHHERFDGTGYLDGLCGNGIHIYARIAAVADVYDAMTSDRVYQKGMHPEVALRRMYKLRGASFEPEIVERLIKCLGIYPIGTFVQLNTGEMAVVSMPNHSDPLKPRVLMLYDNARHRLPRPAEVDLASDGGRWIAASKDPGPLAPFIEKLIA